MRLRHLIVLLSICTVAVSVTMARDMGDLIPGDVNGDHQVNILDLQVLISRALHSEGIPTNPGANLSILDIQQAVAQAEHPPLPEKAREKTVCKVCFFRYQSERTVEPVEEACELGSVDVVRTAHPRPEIPIRSVVPRKTERYLLRLTPNAPPFLV